MIEVAIRFRCQVCATAHERCQVTAQLTLKIEGTINPPKGWHVLPDGRTFCPEHEPKMVQPVSSMAEAIRAAAKSKLN